jgi:ligand-binding SRPBCC domain-containing protein
MGFFSTEQWVPVKLPKVFAFFSDPNNLPRIMPSELQARVVFVDLVEPSNTGASKGAAGIGATITFSFRPLPLLPIRQKWIAQIVEYTCSPDFAAFHDRQLKGPFKA